MSDVLRLEVYQSDWMPGFAAFLDDGKVAEDAKAHIALNLACFLACVETGEVPRADLPYVIAESLMHEVIHALESWAEVEFSEERVEKLLTEYRNMYRSDKPAYTECEEREQPEVTAMRSAMIRLNERLAEAEATLAIYRKPCPYCHDILCDEKCQAALKKKFNDVCFPEDASLRYPDPEETA